MQGTLRRIFVALAFSVVAAASPFRGDIRPVRHSSSEAIPLVASTWYTSQLYDFCVLVDPTDSTKLVMFCSGMASPVNSGVQSIGKFTSTVADPYTWVDAGQVLAPTGGWEGSNLRIGSVFYESGTYYMYYCSDGNGTQSIGLATSTDGATFTRHASNPLLTPTGQGRNDGTNVSEPAVIKEGSSWTMIYSYRGAVTLPGFRYATSSDGITWTKAGSGNLVTTDPLFGEFHQIKKIDGDYYIIYEMGNGSTSWTLNIARAPTVTGPYTNLQINPILEKSGVVGTFDRYHVATPHLFEVENRWLLFYQGGQDHDQPYYTNSWPAGIAEFTRRETGAGGGKGR